ncbi:HAAS domain-containing protein [Peribacillus butanolivorans]|uniref:HAAS domain-containing protein n=1 Tax=Peribacillus butanolivorans TaxID=421767 RepID=UPI0006A74DB1|nr:hypothetical protein [Peribacillus butanolivorans]KON68815.1 hypothetical protein AKG34_08425 [Peribacillus butanolivorans]
MKSTAVNLSSKSKSFLEDLRVYLFSSGKNSDGIESIVEELEVHLMEAEKKGKSIDNIIGQSPKEYMDQISNEMTTDYRSWFKYIVIIIFGAFSFTIINDLFKGNLSYSLLELIGHVCIAAIFILGIFSAFKYVSANNISRGKEFAIYYVLGMLPLGLYIGLIFFNRIIETPVIQFGTTWTNITAIITFVFLIAISWWARSWVVIIILALLTLPDYLLSQFALHDDTQLIVGTLISFGGIAVYLFITSKMSKFD